MLRRLIIGKNSKIIREIADRLTNFDFESHSVINNVIFEKYEYVFLFSWSYSSLTENLKLVEKIPANKLVFISSIAADTLGVRKQWKRYPNYKFAVEKLVIHEGGSVIRIGVWSDSVRKKIHGFVPVTDTEMLIDAIANWNFYSGKTYAVFRIEPSYSSKLSGIVAKRINYFSRALPQIAPIQAVFELLIKYGLRSANYSYTGDVVDSCFDELLVGYGALGSSYAKKYPSRRGIIVSGKKDTVLKNDGFKLTWIGHNFSGLSRYWHGVSIKTHKDGSLRKHVPLFVARPRKVSRALKIHVSEIIDHNVFFELRGETPEGKIRSVYCKRLVLAGGALENCRLLCNFTGVTAALSDHEIGMVGTIPMREAVIKGAVRKRGPFIFRGEVFRVGCGSTSALFDVRPHNPMKHASAKYVNSFYMDSTHGLVLKLIKRFSILTLNEAMFNKFGIGMSTKYCSVFGQFLARDCIKFDLEAKRFIRNRLPVDDLEERLLKLQNIFPSLLRDNKFETFDGQHIQGAPELLKEQAIYSLIQQRRLQILGSPTVVTLGPDHNTISLIKAL